VAPEFDIPREFRTSRVVGVDTCALVVRRGLDLADARPLLDAVAGVPWNELYDAYGPADEVPAQLVAVIVGDDATRHEAWWNLWGNIHHQGTIYEATVPAVPVLLDLAGWREHPDRIEALRMLREIGAAGGIYVWHHGENDALVTREAEQRRLYPLLRATLEAGAAPLLDGWRGEPGGVRRALLWLLSVLPDLRARHETLIVETLPDRHRPAWEMEVAGSVESQEDADAVFALEDWVHSGGD